MAEPENARALGLTARAAREAGRTAARNMFDDDGAFELDGVADGEVNEPPLRDGDE